MGPNEVSLRADGRWQGRLTSRPLPDDESIADLSDDERTRLVDVWLGRAASERRVGDAFVVVRDALIERGAAANLIALASRAIDDEMRHAEIGRQVASRYAGTELNAPSPLPLVVPHHTEASAELRPTLHILGQCAFNETFASAFLEASLARTTAPLARAALRELLADEIDHARIGWAHLAAVGDDVRGQVAPWLVHLAKTNLRMWKTSTRPYPEGAVFEAHGAPAEGTVQDALDAALRDLIVPGCRSLGLAIGPMVQWMDEGAKT
jgi:hypothetical protein